MRRIIILAAMLVSGAAIAQTPPHLLQTAPGAPAPAGSQDSGVPTGQLKNCLLGVPSKWCPQAQALGLITILPTTGGSVTVTDAYNYGIVEVSATAASTITWTCDGTLQLFVVKDMLGNDGQFPITLQPATGAIDGKSSFIMNSSKVSPPFDYQAVLCDANKNSLLL